MESLAHRSFEPAPVDLDEFARLAAHEYFALAFEAERRAYLEDHAHRSTRTVGGWSSATATGARVR